MENKMKRRFCWLLGIALACAAQVASAETFPEGDVFRPLVADPI